ncbi:MAG: glycosyltransferase [Pyrinomonadaceae bacterium]
MDEQFDVSVVISTYNRCDILPGALESVLAQETGEARYELIVVDNNSTDHTREVVESFSTCGHGNVRYLFERQQGLSHARNAGIACARAPIIAFTDDDVRVARDWVAAIKRAFDEHPEVDFVGGKVLPRWETGPPAWLVSNMHWSPLALIDYGDSPFYVNAEKAICLVGANLAFRRGAFEQVGLFSPVCQRVKDGVGSTEDHELLARFWRCQRQGLYAPHITVEAEVQAERMTKRYHRRWHTGHGKFCALMQLEDLERSTAGRLFDVPAHLYRRSLSNLAGWAGSALRRDHARALKYEAELRFFAGFFRQRREDFFADDQGGSVREIATFLRSLLINLNRRNAPVKIDGDKSQTLP